jgi:small-conductance mechanosensitive channel
MTFKQFISKLGDMFLDQAGGVDEKRILGVPIIIVAIVYVCITANIGVFAAIAGLGTTLLGIGVAGDQGKLNVPNSTSNPAAGLPGS